MSDSPRSSLSRDEQRSVSEDRACAKSQAVTVALISDVFYQGDGPNRLRERLREAKDRGAMIAVLPELPCNPWSPATKQQRDDDAEQPGGPRSTMQAEAAAEVGIALVGGAIIHDAHDGKRRNMALVFDAQGKVVGTYCKCHLPEEPGFWETSHYVPGVEHAQVIHGLGVPFGVQICSDINRPEGSHILAAMGAEAIIGPRATELATYERWKVVFRANALTSCAFVLSVNRPSPEQDVLLGGASIAVAPDGRVLLETTDPVGVVTLDRGEIARNKIAYPGYLPVRADLYAEMWREIADEQRNAKPALVAAKQ